VRVRGPSVEPRQKMALVTDKDWIRHAVAVFGPLSPGELRLFEPSETAAAEGVDRGTAALLKLGRWLG
jgi:SpoIIAA-like